jgi:23S rRNA (adenine(2503)-C(2))-methyltransferase
MNIRELKEFLIEKNLPDFRLRQIIKAVYKDAVFSFSEISTLNKDLREELDNNFQILSFNLKNILISKKKDSYKALLSLHDGNIIETVLLKQKDNFWSICVSSQVGCAMNCSFCATGQNGFKRNLSAEEISDQVLFWKQYLRKNKILGEISGVVYMGMGEPFLNYDNLKKSLNILLDENTFNFSSRHLSVSTCGLVEGIKRFAKDFPQLNLAISLNSAVDAKRSEIMPVNNKFNVKDLSEVLEYYFSKNNRKVFLEYILFDGFNNSGQDAQALVDFIKKSSRPELLHVNLIVYNTTDSQLKSPDKEGIRRFKNYLHKHRINATVRRSLGEEIQAACGQLAGE